MIYLLALTIAVSLGILTLRLILNGKFPLYLGLFLGAALGLGIISQMIFYIQLLGNNFNHFIPPLASLLLLGILIFLNRSMKTPLPLIQKNWSLLLRNQSGPQSSYQNRSRFNLYLAFALKPILLWHRG